MARIEDMARAAGFRKRGEVSTANAVAEGSKAFGMDIVTEPRMPKGWIGLRTDKGVTCFGPNGSSFSVPFYISTKERD